MVWSPQPEEGLTSAVSSGACPRPGPHGPDPPSQLPGPPKLSFCILGLGREGGGGQGGAASWVFVGPRSEERDSPQACEGRANPEAIRRVHARQEGREEER